MISRHDAGAVLPVAAPKSLAEYGKRTGTKLR